MADQADVEAALVAVISAALYPNGTSEPSVPGPDCRVYRGWPSSAALDADLATGKVNVTVFPAGTGGRITTRYAEHWAGSPAIPKLTAKVTDTSVTFGGSAEVGQIAGVLVDGISYVYRTRPGDSAELVAANLAAMVRSKAIVRLNHCTFSVAGAGKLTARVVADAQVQREVRRQEQTFRITCWCPTPLARDAAARAVDQVLGSTPFLDLPDGTRGRLAYVGTSVFDQSQNAKLYRRDLEYSVEYPTVLSSANPSMLFGNLVLNSTSITT